MALDDWYSPRTYIDAIRMIPDEKDSLLIIVEGDSDRTYLEKVLKWNIFPIPRKLASNNKSEVIKVARRLLREDRREYFIGIVDRDFDMLHKIMEHDVEEGMTKFGELTEKMHGYHVFFTDSHDLDVDAYWGRITEMLEEGTEPERVEKFLCHKASSSHNQGHADKLFEFITSEACILGIIKFILSRKNISTEIEIERHCQENLEVIPEKLIETCGEDQRTKEELQLNFERYKRRVDELNRQYGSEIVKQVVNGHDLLKLLAFFVHILGSETLFLCEQSFLDKLQRPLECAEFKNLRLYRDLKEWADQKGIVLCS